MCTFTNTIIIKKKTDDGIKLNNLAELTTSGIDKIPIYDVASKLDAVIWTWGRFNENIENIEA